MNAEQMVSIEIARRKATRATGAIAGIRKPIPPKPCKPLDMSTEAVERRAVKAKANRAYYDRNKHNITAAKRTARKAGVKKTYVYFPSIPQARDIRSSGDKLDQYRAEVTAALQIWDDNHAVAVAHSEREQALDMALQQARRPTGVHFSINYFTREMPIDPGIQHAGIDLGRFTDTMWEVLPPLPPQ